MKKKIFVASFGSDVGGIEKSLIEFLTLLVSEGHEVDLCLWKEPGILFSKIPKEINMIDSNSLNPGSLRAGKVNLTRLFWYILFRMAQKMGIPTKVFKGNRKQYDIAISYCQNGYSPYYVIDKICAKKKYIWYHHGAYEKPKLEKVIDYFYYSKYDKFVTVSNANKVMLLEHFPRLKEKIIVINNLVNEENIIDKSNEKINIDTSKENTIVTIGRVAPEKGQLFAIDVAFQLKKMGISFVWYFIGDGPDLSKCVKRVIEMNLESECVFLGAKENPYSYMAIADVYVQPSLIEADPIAIIESKILKKAIVASDIPAIREKLQDGKLGKVTERTVDKFVGEIFALLSYKEEIKKYEEELKKCSSDNIFIKETIKELLK